MSARLIEGFDYHAGRAIARSRADWRAVLASAVRAGGLRRVEQGETFICGPGRGRPVLAEVYAILPAVRA